MGSSPWHVDSLWSWDCVPGHRVALLDGPVCMWVTLSSQPWVEEVGRAWAAYRDGLLADVSMGEEGAMQGVGSAEAEEDETDQSSGSQEQEEGQRSVARARVIVEV